MSPVRDSFVKKSLKSLLGGADSPDVLVERLIVEGDGEAASVDFHPRLTVLGGMPGDARGAFGALLSGALHGTVRGVHLEVVDDSGRRLVVLRPASGPHRVIDVVTADRRHRPAPGLRRPGRPPERPVRPLDHHPHHRRRPAQPHAAQRRRAGPVGRRPGAPCGAPPTTLVRGKSRGDAAATWRALAGDTDVHWAIDHRTEIQAAARLRQHIAALRSLSSSAPDLSDDDAVALAQAIVSQLTAATNAAGHAARRSLLDETFDQLEPAVVPLLLELLPGLVGDLQVILLTEDEAIASWARLEALAGELALVEPALAAD